MACKKFRIYGRNLKKSDIQKIKKSNPRHKFRTRKAKKRWNLYVGVKKSKKGNWVYDFKK